MDELRAEQVLRIDAEDPKKIIQLFEPLVIDRRRERLLHVIGQRLASVTVLMEAPHDPHNGAAVARSCEAFGVQKLHVVEQREKFLAAASVTRGAHKWIDIEAYANADSALERLLAQGMELVATHPEGELLPEDLASIERVALVFGNERDGISAAVRSACSRSVRVPMRGFIESLNVSVTAAILLSAATRNRAGDLGPNDHQRLYARGLYFSCAQADKILGWST